MPPEFWYFLIGQGAMAVGVYAAIRADLAALKMQVSLHEKRLDQVQAV